MMHLTGIGEFFKGLTPAYLENSSFSNKLPTLQLYWDSTSMGTLMDCPRKYLLSNVFGFAPRDESVHLRFGIMYHSALETYDRVKALYQKHDHDTDEAIHRTAMFHAVRKALSDSWNFELKRPWASDHKYKNRLTLIRS